MGEVKVYNQKGEVPLARLQLRLSAREGEVKYLNQLGRKDKTPGTPVSPGRARLSVIPALAKCFAPYP